MSHNRSFNVGNGQLHVLLYVLSSTQHKTHFKQQKYKHACLNNYRDCSYGHHLTRLFRPGAAIRIMPALNISLIGIRSSQMYPVTLLYTKENSRIQV